MQEHFDSVCFEQIKHMAYSWICLEKQDWFPKHLLKNKASPDFHVRLPAQSVLYNVLYYRINIPKEGNRMV